METYNLSMFLLTVELLAVNMYAREGVQIPNFFRKCPQISETIFLDQFLADSRVLWRCKKTLYFFIDFCGQGD